MKKEIAFQEGQIVFFKESNFWNDLLERCSRETKSIRIATYNFNFRDKYEKTFYRELSKLANSGIDINLLYSKITFSEEDQLEIEEIFKNFVLCAELKTNHSKIFIADNFAFIGSANFSFGSNKNYESGVIFENKEIISEIRKFYGEELLEKSNFTNVPASFDPFVFLPRILNAVENLSKIARKEDLYIRKTQEEIPELRFLDDLKRHLEELGRPIPGRFNWFPFYMQLAEDEEFYVSDTDFRDFKSYIHELLPYLIDVKTLVNKQYKSIGRIELLKRINAIK